MIAIVGAASKSTGSSFPFVFILLIGFVLLWFIVVRPRQKRQNQSRQMLSELRVGDDVLTAGGVYGRVTGIDEDEVRVEIAPQVDVRVARRAIAAILTEHDEPQPASDEHEAEGEGDERWHSAFGEGSDEEKPG